MKASEIREKSQSELDQELAALKSELFKLRFQLATNQLDNPMKLKEVKKSIGSVTINKAVDMHDEFSLESLGD